MTRRRRGLLLIGLSMTLGGLAAADVGRREAALARHDGPLVEVLVAARDLAPGERPAADDLRVRRVPARYAPPDAVTDRAQAVGQELPAGLAAGAFVTYGALPAPEQPAALRRGERAVEVVAAGLADLITPGARVDVLITREQGGTELFLRDAEVLGATAAPAAADGTAARVAATLRVTLRQAVALTEAQSFAREIRLLPRP